MASMAQNTENATAQAALAITRSSLCREWKEHQKCKYGASCVFGHDEDLIKKNKDDAAAKAMTKAEIKLVAATKAMAKATAAQNKSGAPKLTPEERKQYEVDREARKVAKAAREKAEADAKADGGSADGGGGK